MQSKPVICAGLFAVIACASPRFRATPPREPDPIVTFNTGTVAYDGYMTWSYYLIDRPARLCYFSLAGHIAVVDCCALVAHEAARPHLTWCAPAAPDSAGPPGSDAPAAPPGSPPPR